MLPLPRRARHLCVEQRRSADRAPQPDLGQPARRHPAQRRQQPRQPGLPRARRRGRRDHLGGRPRRQPPRRQWRGRGRRDQPRRGAGFADSAQRPARQPCLGRGALPGRRGRGLTPQSCPRQSDSHGARRAVRPPDHELRCARVLDLPQREPSRARGMAAAAEPRHRQHGQRDSAQHAAPSEPRKRQPPHRSPEPRRERGLPERPQPGERTLRDRRDRRHGERSGLVVRRMARAHRPGSPVLPHRRASPFRVSSARQRRKAWRK